MSKRLIDILEDDTKMSQLHSNLKYKQSSIIPKLEKLYLCIYDNTTSKVPTVFIKEDLIFVKNLIEDLKGNPHHRATGLELTECNNLWDKYK